MVERLNEYLPRLNKGEFFDVCVCVISVLPDSYPLKIEKMQNFDVYYELFL